MPAYQFLGISKKTTPHGEYEQADALIHGTDGRKTTFNHRRFENIAVGSHFIMDYNKSYPDNPVTIIDEAVIPEILAHDKKAAAEAQAEYEKKRAENIATGRFKYWYTDFRGNSAENILETLSTNYDEFWQKLADVLNEGSYLGGRPKENKLTVEDMKKDERLAKFMEHAQPGDKLDWYSWNGGFLAYSAGPHITRGEECVAYHPWIVS